MSIHSSWLTRGYFDMSEEDSRPTTTQEIRDALAATLADPMRIAMYPIGPNWKHTFWWRDGSEDYTEAQFFMRIAEDYPILSVGVSVEKGLELPAVTERDSKHMNRRTWDWQRLTDRCNEVLETDVPFCAQQLHQPINL
jgi:hypothetical protein